MKLRLTHHLLAALISVALTTALHAQSSAFTYQGQLTDNGNPANGYYDFTFSVWTNSAGPAQVGDTITNLAVPVSDGLFTVTLDFGAGVFDAGERWLELGAVTNSGGAFSTLSPRQEINATPYAVRALEAGAVPAGTITTDMLANGAVTALKIESGAISRLGTPDGSESNVVQVTDAGLVGIGATNPGAKLTISRSAQAAAYQLELRNEGSIQSPNFDGVVFTQGASGQIELGAMKVLYRNYGRPDLSLGVRERSDALFIHGNYNGQGGNVGIGTTDPQARLHVNGDLKVDGNITVPATTRYLIVGASDMVPQNSSMYVYRSFASIVSFFTPAGQATTLYAPVHLPDGATVTELRAFLHDNVPDDDVYVSLEAEGRGGGFLFLATIYTDGTPGSIEAVDDTIADPVIDNSVYSYYLRAVYTVPPVDGETYFRIRPVRIAYEVMSPLP